MKHPPMDLSRFAKCTIKKPAICDLLMVDEFRRAVGEFDGEITDEWVVKTVLRLQGQLYGMPGYMNLHQHERKFRKEFPEYV